MQHNKSRCKNVQTVKFDIICQKPFIPNDENSQSSARSLKFELVQIEKKMGFFFIVHVSMTKKTSQEKKQHDFFHENTD